VGQVILDLVDVGFRYPEAEQDALRRVELSVRGGELLGLVGPNGSGKTTLLRLAAGALRATSGQVSILERPINRWSRRDLACTVGVVSQREEPAFPMKVEETVLLGRYPHLGPWRGLRSGDREIVAHALERCDVVHLRDRWVATLSAGEWQRVRIARALAQQPRALLLDEATANLDVRHEMEVFELVSELVRMGEIAGMIVTHNVNLAARFVDRVMVLDHGTARSVGVPGEVLRRELLEEIFEWPVEVRTWQGVPQFIPLRKPVTDSDAD
jgi:ABC-type cobalamin/Fe3+-siderophores transport system ATPase subunit